MKIETNIEKLKLSIVFEDEDELEQFRELFHNYDTSWDDGDAEHIVNMIWDEIQHY